MLLHWTQTAKFTFWYNENSINYLKMKNILKKSIVQLIKTYDVNHFISGMALGVDQYAAEIVLELKKQYPQITLECAIPCETQAIKWTETHVTDTFLLLNIVIKRLYFKSITLLTVWKNAMNIWLIVAAL